MAEEIGVSRKLVVASAATFAFVLVELAIGILGNSLALIEVVDPL